MTELMQEQNCIVMLERAFEKYAHRQALVYLGRTFTYGDLKESIDRFAGALSGLGLKKGDAAIIYLPNTPQFVISFFALMKLGVIAVPISPLYTPQEVRYMSRDSGAETIICQDTNFGYVKEVMPRSSLKRIIYTGLIDMLPWLKRLIGYGFKRIPHGRIEKDSNTYHFPDLLKLRIDPPQVEIEPLKDLAYVLYTGGTTGLPKGVPASHAFFYQCVSEMSDYVIKDTFVEEGRSCAVLVLPLFHALAQAVLLGEIFPKGNKCILMPESQPDAISECIQKYKVDILAGVPTLYRMILENDRVDQYDFSSLRYCWSGGDALPGEIFHRWKKKFGVPLHQGYGATEAWPISFTKLDKEPPMGSVGPPINSPYKKYKFVDEDTLEPVAPGTPGELLVCMSGSLNRYLDKPEEDAYAYVKLNDGNTYYRTRDVFKIKDGELYFVDRSADIIKYKGYRISASEIETVLQDHPAVTASCVVGVPDPKVGERIKGFVVLKQDVRGVSSQDLMRFCRERLAPYKVPKYIEFRDMLPKSKVGKLLRRGIRNEERMKITGGEDSQG
ncbi:MAG: AMP-binding protein [Thermodesulfobacteriota bacterium]|nr:AMP-binding protein [Thermodesulfobacteriota bacterium]